MLKMEKITLIIGILGAIGAVTIAPHSIWRVFFFNLSGFYKELIVYAILIGFIGSGLMAVNLFIDRRQSWRLRITTSSFFLFLFFIVIYSEYQYFQPKA